MRWWSMQLNVLTAASLYHEQIKEYVDGIARARWGDVFPKEGVEKL